MLSQLAGVKLGLYHYYIMFLPLQPSNDYVSKKKKGFNFIHEIARKLYFSFLIISISLYYY